MKRATFERGSHHTKLACLVIPASFRHPSLLHYNTKQFLPNLCAQFLRIKMSIIVRSVSDTELHRACIIEAAAYADNDLNPVLFPGPFPTNSQQRRVDQLVQMRKDDPTAVYIQAIDRASGRMIASAKWHIYRTPEETKIPIRKLEFGPGTNPEACMAFFGGMMEKKKEIMGTRPHLCMLQATLHYENVY